MIERLPTPWGLVRLGVAPDHPKIKSVSRAFEKTALQPGFRFLGNIEVGRDVHARSSSTTTTQSSTPSPAPTDRRLGSGEDLPGSLAATEFVAWYNGHPDFQELQFDLSGERAVVIGNGNVAVDVARMLALTPEELAPTDTTDAAIAAINGAGVREIVMVGRRGPAQAAFTTPELFELGELAGADVIVDPADLEGAEGTDTNSTRNLEVLREYAAREPAGKPKRLVLRFLLSPAAILGDERVEGSSSCTTGSSPTRRARSAHADGGDRDARMRHRLSQRRLPRRCPARRPVRREPWDDRERGRSRRAGRLRGRVDQAGPERRDRHEQEGRGGDRRAPPRRPP